MLLVTQIKGCPDDFLAGHEMKDLEIRDLEGKVVASIPAAEPWTPVALFDAVAANRKIIDESDVADCYLGEKWIGSTEL